MRALLLSVLLWSSSTWAIAQQTGLPTELSTPGQIGALVQEVTNTQSQYVSNGGAVFSYKAHWVNRKGDETVEAVIGSADGRVGRVLIKDGQPISVEKNNEERKRLEDLLRSGNLRGESKDAVHLRPYILELVRAMPQAMLYTSTPGQPQLPDLNLRQLVLDYSPNPAFRARSLAENALGKLSGRFWVDAGDHRLLRLEIRVNNDVNVVGGILAKVYSGGTVEYDQRRIAEGQYAFTHVRLHLRLRELLLRTVPVEADLTATDIQLLSPLPSGPDAIRSLLALQVKTR